VTEPADVEAIVRSRSAPVDLVVEHRFPLGLTPTLPEIWDLYETSKTVSWDPEDSALLAGRTSDDYPDEVRGAAALLWSRRAWVEFPGMAESEALLVRFCLEPAREVDAKYCLSCRAVEKARATDACRILADWFSGYVDDSPSADLVEALESDRVRWALHAEADIDASVVGLLCVEALIDLRLWEATVDATTDPTVRRFGDQMLVDKRRQVSFGWAYLDSRASSFEDDKRVALSAAADRTVRDELRGRRVSALLPPGPGRDALTLAQDHVAVVGAGAVATADEVAVLGLAVEECRRSLHPYGLSLSTASHPERGDF